MIVFNVLILVIPIIGLLLFNNKYVSIALLVFCIHFFYSPDMRYNNYKKDVLYSPSQGYVRNVDVNTGTDEITISLFLNIFDNHTQYFPLASKVVEQNIYKGKFVPAYQEHSINNKRVETVLLSTDHNFIYRVLQITGLLTRRIHSFVEPDERYEPGERLGFIALGSRVDIVVPRKKVRRILVSEGDRVKAMQEIIEIMNTNEKTSN